MIRPHQWLAAFLAIAAGGCASAPTRQSASPVLIKPGAAQIAMHGRIHWLTEGSAQFGYPGVSLEFRAIASEILLTGQSSQGQNLLDVFINGAFSHTVRLPAQPAALPVFAAPQARPVAVRLVHNTETWQGLAQINHVAIRGSLLAPSPEPPRKLLVIGDSIACGEAVARPADAGANCSKTAAWWRASNAFGMLLGEQIHAQTYLVCYGGRGLVRSWDGRTDQLNAPEFYGRTLALAGGPLFDNTTSPADIIVIMLGTNDFDLRLGAFPTEATYISAYVAWLKRRLQDHPTAHIFLSAGPMVNDLVRPQKATLEAYLQHVQTRVANARVHLAPVSHQPGDACDAHPTGAQHQAIAQELHRHIQPWLNKP